MKLISMTDFIENLRKEMTIKGELNFSQTKKYFDKVFNYSEFLKQPLKLEMFVPCVDDSPIEYYKLKKTGGKFCQAGSDIEKQAKEKVLFEGFEIEQITKDYSIQLINNITNIRIIFWDKNKRIESAEISKYIMHIEDLNNFNISLTESAIKQIGL